MGPTSVGVATPRHRHRVITFVIIGVAIFVVAAVAAAQIHKARSAVTGAKAQSQGTGRSAAASAAGSHRPGRALNSSPAGLPAGFRWYSERAGTAGSGTAGFRVALPTGWRVTRTGMRTFIEEPAGTRFLELDLTPHAHASMMAELLWMQRQSLLQGTFPGYHSAFIKPVRYQGTAAADWAFSWRSPSGGPTDVRDRVLMTNGPAGSQSFAIYWSTPASQWWASRPLLGEVYATFSPVW